MRLVARTLFWPKDVSVELKGEEYGRGLILCFEGVDFRWVASSIDEVMDIVDKYLIMLWFFQMLWIFEVSPDDRCIFLFINFPWALQSKFHRRKRKPLRCFLALWFFSVRYSQSSIAANRRSHYNFNLILPDLYNHTCPKVPNCVDVSLKWWKQLCAGSSIVAILLGRFTNLSFTLRNTQRLAHLREVRVTGEEVWIRNSRLRRHQGGSGFPAVICFSRLIWGTMFLKWTVGSILVEIILHIWMHVWSNHAVFFSWQDRVDLSRQSRC